MMDGGVSRRAPGGVHAFHPPAGSNPVFHSLRMKSDQAWLPDKAAEAAGGDRDAAVGAAAAERLRDGGNQVAFPRPTAGSREA